MTHKSVLQECPTRGSSKSVRQECPTRVSHKRSVPQECPTRVSARTHKSVLLGETLAWTLPFRKEYSCRITPRSPIIMDQQRSGGGLRGSRASPDASCYRQQRSVRCHDHAMVLEMTWDPAAAQQAVLESRKCAVTQRRRQSPRRGVA